MSLPQDFGCFSGRGESLLSITPAVAKGWSRQTANGLCVCVCVGDLFESESVIPQDAVRNN